MPEEIDWRTVARMQAEDYHGENHNEEFHSFNECPFDPCQKYRTLAEAEDSSDDEAPAGLSFHVDPAEVPEIKVEKKKKPFGPDNYFEILGELLNSLRDEDGKFDPKKFSDTMQPRRDVFPQDMIQTLGKPSKPMYRVRVFDLDQLKEWTDVGRPSMQQPIWLPEVQRLVVFGDWDVEEEKIEFSDEWKVEEKEEQEDGEDPGSQ